MALFQIGQTYPRKLKTLPKLVWSKEEDTSEFFPFSEHLTSAASVYWRFVGLTSALWFFHRTRGAHYIFPSSFSDYTSGLSMRTSAWSKNHPNLAYSKFDSKKDVKCRVQVKSWIFFYLCSALENLTSWGLSDCIQDQTLHKNCSYLIQIHWSWKPECLTLKVIALLGRQCYFSTSGFLKTDRCVSVT